MLRYVEFSKNSAVKVPQDPCSLINPLTKFLGGGGGGGGGMEAVTL